MSGRSRTRQQRDEDAAVYVKYQLIAEAGLGKIAEIQGVTIDLSCDLEPSEWQPLSPLGFYGNTAALFGPEIIFPWTTEGWKNHYISKGSIVEAPAGSKISVAAVAAAPISTSFEDLDHPAHRETKLVYLAVENADRSISLVNSPLIFLRTESVATHIENDDYISGYRGMIVRLEEVLGTSDVEDFRIDDIETWPKVPADSPRSYVHALIALARRDEFIDGEAMAAFGYMIARAEAEEHLLASAKRGDSALRATRRASSAKLAKDKAQSVPILKRASDIIENNRAISLTACAKIIASEFQKDQRWVSRLLKRELFEPRPGGSEYRPRRPD